MKYHDQNLEQPAVPVTMGKTAYAINGATMNSALNLAICKPEKQISYGKPQLPKKRHLHNYLNTLILGEFSVLVCLNI